MIWLKMNIKFKNIFKIFFLLYLFVLITNILSKLYFNLYFSGLIIYYISFISNNFQNNLLYIYIPLICNKIPLLEAPLDLISNIINNSYLNYKTIIISFLLCLFLSYFSICGYLYYNENVIYNYNNQHFYLINYKLDYYLKSEKLSDLSNEIDQIMEINNKLIEESEEIDELIFRLLIG
jgi:hypothetical protein